MASCPMCDKLQSLDSLPATEIVWQFPHSVALLGTHQYYRGYCVLICRHHERELSGLSDPIRRAYFDEMCLLARAQEAAFAPLKLNYELLGNQVPHLHWHLFPRHAIDPDRLQPVWLALHQSDSDSALRHRLEGMPGDRPEISAALRHHLLNLYAPTA